MQVFRRREYKVETFEESDESVAFDNRYPVGENEGNAYSSEAIDIFGNLMRGMHAPVIDIDLPVEMELVPSSTEGHYHLYINRIMEWEKYKALLVAMEDAGLIEGGYLNACLVREASFVRKPGVKK